MKQTKGYMVSGLFAAMLCLSGCSDTKNNSNVLAEIGDRPITENEFKAYLQHKRIPAQDSKRKEREFTNYLDREIVSDAIEKSGEMDQQLLDVQIREYKKQLVISQYFQKFLKEKVTDQAVKNFYNGNVDKYESKKIHVAHVLIRTNEKMTEKERKALLSKAGEVYSFAVRQKDFEQLAKDYSEDKISGKNGGDLGWVEEGAIHPVFSSTVFGMKVGEISQPFATSFGYHVVKVLDDAKIVRKPFEAMEGDIRYQLQQQSKDAELERLRSSLKVKRMDEKANG